MPTSLQRLRNNISLETQIFDSFSTNKNYRFIPYDRFEYSLPLSFDEVRKKLLEEIETDPRKLEKNWRTGKCESKKSFEGTFNGPTIAMSQLSASRNSFAPEIKFVITEVHAHKTIIRGTQKLHPVVLIFSIVIFVGQLFAAISIGIYSLQESKGMTGISISLLALLFSYSLIIGIFSFGKKHTRAFFAKIFPSIQTDF